jgi:hypothetical protein
MTRVDVLEDHFLAIAANSCAGVCSEIWHVYPSQNNSGRRTPVGYVLAYPVQPSELQRLHWRAELFIRRDLHYDASVKSVTVVRGGTVPPSYNLELPNAVGRALLAHTSCSEPLVVTINIYQPIDCINFGRVWIEEDE